MRFSAVGSADVDVFDGAAGLWASGASRPEWCWLATDGGRVLARAGLYVAEDPADPPSPARPDVEPDLLAHAWAQVPYTIGLFGLAYPAGPAVATELIHAMLDRADLPPGTVVQARTNREDHPDAATRCSLLEAAGFDLFQEKQGYAWTAPAPQPPAASLTSRTLAEIGAAEFLTVLASAGADTLDRNDRFYYARCGPRGWARVLLEYMTPELTLVGYDAGGEPAGFVAVSAFDEPDTATIVHIGVLPGQRGHGYGRQLLATATRAAEAAGFTAMLSDVDVENAPMAAAFLACGHRDDRRPWHLWHYRQMR